MRTSLCRVLVIVQLVMALVCHEHADASSPNRGMHLHLHFLDLLHPPGDNHDADDHDDDAIYFPDGVALAAPTHPHDDPAFNVEVPLPCLPAPSFGIHGFPDICRWLTPPGDIALSALPVRTLPLRC